VRGAKDVELADLLETVLLRVGCSHAESELHSMVELDLSVSQFRCLVALAGVERAIPIHELAELVHLTFATAGRAVDRLVVLDLVIRREHPHDRRVRLVCLSAKGRQVLSGIDEARRRGLLAFVRSLDPADRARLHAALAPIADRATTPSLHIEEVHA